MHKVITDINTAIDVFLQQYAHGIVVFWWATATGKSSASIEIARLRAHMAKPCEIISADSRQIFRYMNIGTDKVQHNILSEIPHHQIDIVDPDWFYTAGEWKKDVCKHIVEIHARNATPLIVWGTGLYIDTLYKNYAVPEVVPDFTLRTKREQEEESDPWTLWKKLHSIDPAEAKKHHPNSIRYIIRALEIYEKTGKTKTDIATEQPVQRPMLMIGMWRGRDDSNQRIATRVDEMVRNGLIKEVEGLLAQWYTAHAQAMQWIGYKETIAYLLGEITKEQLIAQITLHTQQYAKRQRTWFRRYIADAEKNPKKDVVYKVFMVE